MSEELSTSGQRVQDALRALGLPCRVVELPQSTRTSAEAAKAVGCSVEQIAKSLVFRGAHTGRAILVIASGSNRVSERKMAELISEPVEKADAAFVRQRTGFAIGGVPPIGHLERLETFVDEDLLKYKEIWAAAGNPNAVFRLTPEELVRMTGGRTVSVK